MPEPPIRDIPSFKKMIEDAANARATKRAMPILRPLLKGLRVDFDGIDKALSNLEELEKTTLEIATIPDRFNDLFAEQGWIIYEQMSLEVAKAAIHKAEMGDMDGAQASLVAYYDDDRVAFCLRTMTAVQAFRPRMNLAEKALIDYREKRYHACVPVVLALLDGMVNELHEKGLGFFNKDTSLEAWDSIAAHSKGLNAIKKIFQKSRRKTVTEEIFIPYRHGILHGMDLGYDNRMVAAKSWAALFAAREWALKAERGELAAPPEKPKKTWCELIQQIRETQRRRDFLTKWQPRDIQVGTSVPARGAPDEYTERSPERKLTEYLHAWKRRNYGFMAKCVPNYSRVSENAMAGNVRKSLAHINLESFEIIEIRDVAPAVTEIGVALNLESNGSAIQQGVTFRLINQDTDALPVAYGVPQGEWVIHNWEAVQPLANKDLP